MKNKYNKVQPSNMSSQDEFSHSNDALNDIYTQIIFSAQNGILENIKDAFDKNISLDFVDHYGRTLLMLALCDENKKPDRDIIKYLISCNVRVSTVDRNGQTIMMYCAKNKYDVLEIMSWLILCRASIDHVDCNGNSALSIANSLGNMDSVNFLLEEGAKATQTLLKKICIQACIYDNLSCLKTAILLLEHDIPTDQLLKNASTSCYGSKVAINIIENILSGTDKSTVDDIISRTTLLLYACTIGSLYLVERISTEYGVSIDFTEYNKHTHILHAPIFYAVKSKNDNVNLIQYFSSYLSNSIICAPYILQASVDAKNNDITKYLINSALKYNPDTIFEHNIMNEALCNACEKNDYELATLTIQYGANTNYINYKHDRSPLMLTLQHSTDTQIIELLFKNNVKINLVFENNNMLQKPIQYKSAAVMEHLIEYMESLSNTPDSADFSNEDTINDQFTMLNIDNEAI
jgi:ankyrin repeat protein